METESVLTESVQTESVQTESAQTEVVQTESVQTESVQTEIVQTERVQTEAAVTLELKKRAKQTKSVYIARTAVTWKLFSFHVPAVRAICLFSSLL